MAFADAARERGRVVRAAAPLVERLERDALRRSDVVIAVSEDYVPPLTQWGIRRDAIEIVTNWAPLEDLPALPKNNGWARDHGLAAYFAQAVNRELTNADVLPFQSAEDYAGVLGAADVLLAGLHNQAGRYSVPSKILSYRCAAARSWPRCPTTTKRHD